MDEAQTRSEPTTPQKKPDSQPRKNSFWKRPAVILLGTVVVGFLLFLGLRYLAESFTHESTDDAFLDGDITSLAPKVAGQVKSVYVTSNQRVKAGDVLLEIDPRDLAVQMDQKRAAFDSARANLKLILSSLDLLRKQIETAEATAKQAEAEAAASEAAAAKATADLKRADQLIQQKTISPQEFDSARAAAVSAQASLNAAREKAVSDKSKIAEVNAQLATGTEAYHRAEAQAHQSELDVQQADLNLSYTRMTAPQDGQITRKSVAAGDYVQVGQRLMALVLRNIWVTANFKETQLKKIRPNQPVRITIDSIAGRSFSGRVESIQAGSGARFSLLPPENAVGNYVKVVQRVPVRILFDAPIDAEHVLGPGMSVVPSVRVKSCQIPQVVMLLVVLVLAIIIGLVWWTMAQRSDKQNVNAKRENAKKE